MTAYTVYIHPLMDVGYITDLIGHRGEADKDGDNVDDPKHPPHLDFERSLIVHNT